MVVKKDLMVIMSFKAHPSKIKKMSPLQASEGGKVGTPPLPKFKSPFVSEASIH